MEKLESAKPNDIRDAYLNAIGGGKIKDRPKIRIMKTDVADKHSRVKVGDIFAVHDVELGSSCECGIVPENDKSRYCPECGQRRKVKWLYINTPRFVRYPVHVSDVELVHA